MTLCRRRKLRSAVGQRATRQRSTMVGILKEIQTGQLPAFEECADVCLPLEMRKQESRSSSFPARAEELRSQLQSKRSSPLYGRSIFRAPQEAKADSRLVAPRVVSSTVRQCEPDAGQVRQHCQDNEDVDHLRTVVEEGMRSSSSDPLANGVHEILQSLAEVKETLMANAMSTRELREMFVSRLKRSRSARNISRIKSAGDKDMSALDSKEACEESTRSALPESPEPRMASPAQGCATDSTDALWSSSKDRDSQSSSSSPEAKRGDNATRLSVPSGIDVATAIVMEVVSAATSQVDAAIPTRQMPPLLPSISRNAVSEPPPEPRPSLSQVPSPETEMSAGHLFRDRIHHLGQRGCLQEPCDVEVVRETVDFMPYSMNQVRVADQEEFLDSLRSIRQSLSSASQRSRYWLHEQRAVEHTAQPVSACQLSDDELLRRRVVGVDTGRRQLHSRYRGGEGACLYETTVRKPDSFMHSLGTNTEGVRLCTPAFEKQVVRLIRSKLPVLPISLGRHIIWAVYFELPVSSYGAIRASLTPASSLHVWVDQSVHGNRKHVRVGEMPMPTDDKGQCMLPRVQKSYFAKWEMLHPGCRKPASMKPYVLRMHLENEERLLELLQSDV